MLFKRFFQKTAAFSLKVALIGALCLSYYLLKDSKFKDIDFFVKDSLQYLNSTDNVDKSLVTLTLNILSDDITYPHTLGNIKKVIDKLQTYEPKNIIIMMEPLDFHFKANEKKELFDYLNSQKNVFLNTNEAREYNAIFSVDTYFKNFARKITFVRCLDNVRDKQSRRAMLSIDPHPEVALFNELKELGLNVKPKEYFKYSFRYWDSQQAYLKNYPLGTYGNYQTKDLFSNNLRKELFKDKVIVLGTNDHYSFLGAKSTFSLFNIDRTSEQTKFQIPIQDVFANVINFHTTGEYIKNIGDFNDLLVLVIMLSLLVFSSANISRKVYIFLSILPIIIFTQVVIYLIGDFYIDFSRSLVLLVLLQYFAIPFVLLVMFKKEEKKKLQEINDARIDALLSVSEKVAHDIRSPLGAINLILSRIKFENDEYKEIVKNAIERIDNTAENILQKYKFKNDSRTEIFEKIYINNMLRKLISEKSILDSKIDFVLDINSTEKVYGLGFSVELERVVSNIIDNSIFAVQKIQKQPTIKIFTQLDDNKLIITIFDNGRGIPINILKLLGNEQITTKNKENGHGIGLLHAKRTIERMNGTLHIESVENEYSQMVITLRATN